MTEHDWAVLLHLAGVVLIFSGASLAGAAHAGARRRQRPGEIAVLLGLTRTGVVLVASGAIVIVASGLWLIEVSEGTFSLGDGWIVGTLGLLVLAFILGAFGGQRLKRARVLAEGREDGAPVDDIQALVDDTLSLALSYAAALALVAGLVIMVWKPGL